MKEQIKNAVTHLWPFAVFFVGLFFVLSPYLDGIFDVCCPYLWRYYLSSIFFFAEMLLPIIAIIYLGVVLVIFLRKSQKAIMAKLFIPFISIVVIWGIFNTLGLHRIDFFPVGGELRLWLIDKPETIRLSAIELLSSDTQDEIRSENIPNDLRPLLITHAEIDREFKIVNTHIFTHALFGARGDFGYLFQEDGSRDSIDQYLLQTDYGYRLWELQDGIFFYQRIRK